MTHCRLLFALCMSFAIPAAANPVFDIPSGGIHAFTSEFTWGFEFNVSSSLTISALGFWDEGSDGVGESHAVGLWDSSGVLIAQVTVDNASTPAISASSAGRWLFTALPEPVTLPAGNYLLGAYFPTDTDALRQGTFNNSLVITSIPGVTYVGPQRSPVSSDGLAIPTLNQVPNGVPNGVFGPNLLEAVVVPTMPFVAWIALAGLLGAAAVWHGGRRFRTSSSG